MQAKSAYKQYATVHISTVDRGRLLLMLYDGCIKFLKHAKDGLEKKDIAKFARFMSKAQAIISELMLTLDFEKGGQIAKDLDRLYDFMLFYLTEANLEKNPVKIQRVLELVEIVASAYREVIEGQAKSALPGGEPVDGEQKRLEADPARGQNISVSF
ncbi:MAG TPA: flagellar export chaperone FliS [Oligoflexia bacterium]|nr:flagellar export chaperone FliS [Oligoflexia bacterium]